MIRRGGKAGHTEKQNPIIPFSCYHLLGGIETVCALQHCIL